MSVSTSIYVHCCKSEHYTFDILKCGGDLCTICKPVRLPSHIFSSLRHIPHPSPGDDGHYLSFAEALLVNTTGEHHPSLSIKANKSSSNTLPFYASVQHVQNAQLMVQCDNCEMWRLIFSNKTEQRQYLQMLLSDLSYTCGSQLCDLNLPAELDNVENRVHQCGDTIEKLYYSAKYDPICVYCGVSEPFSNEDCYPRCQNCNYIASIKEKVANCIIIFHKLC